MTKLSTGEFAALRDLASGGDFAPERNRRGFFHRLIDHGFAKWCGYGLGGESFTITEAGRAALEQGGQS